MVASPEITGERGTSVSTAFEVTATKGRVPDGVIVSVYPDRAGLRYQGGKLRLAWPDYAAFARMCGIEPVPYDQLPQPDDDLAATIAADAAEVLNGVSPQKVEGSLVDDWNRHFQPGTPVRYWPSISGEFDDPDSALIGFTHGQASLVGGRAAVWISDYGSPVALSHVQPRP